MLPIIHHPAYNADIPAHHRFPMGKFKRLMEVLQEDGIAHEENTFTPVPAPPSWLTLAHSQTYVDQVLNGTVPEKISREIGFPMSESVAMRARCATAGTVLAARMALDHGIAANTAGGSHHARFEQGAGFCVFNDVAVAIRVLQAEGLIHTALIVDLDVHQGDGTARIFAGDEDIFTLSFHSAKNYPTRKATSNLDIALADDLEDGPYLAKLAEVLPKLVEAGKPDIIFYNAGVDPHIEDRLGRLALSDDGLQQRDSFVITQAHKHAIPITCVIGGGYMEDIDRLARRHSILHRTATSLLNDDG